VSYGEYRVQEYHSWTRVTHHGANSVALICGVTVDSTFCAGGFLFLECAVRQTAHGIAQQFGTLVTRGFVGTMLVAAIDIDHEGKRFRFACATPV
jgi:hypothetical protein